MAKSKLLTALDQHKGIRPDLQKQRKHEKEARKRKQKNAPTGQNGAGKDETNGVKLNGAQKPTVNTPEAQLQEELEEAEGADSEEEDILEFEDEGEVQVEDDADNGAEDVDEDAWEGVDDDEDEDEDEDVNLEASRLDDESDSEVEELTQPAPPTKSAPKPAQSAKAKRAQTSEENDDEDDSDVPLSDLEDLSDADKEDMIPHQRLTINNTVALNAALNRIRLPPSSSATSWPFSELMSITSSAPTSDSIPDVEDDLTRELAFYKQCLEAATEGRRKLIKEGIPFARPSDYFAEMVKTDAHMQRVKRKLVDEAAIKKASQEARKQRDLKKFGKAVQVAKLQERSKQKRETLDKINTLKRKRKDAGGAGEATHESDLFDVELDDAASAAKKARLSGKGGKGAAGKDSRDSKPNFKRKQKDEKYGFGGKKRFSKSNDAKSSADMSGFSHKRMKKSAPGGAKKRVGKDRRAKGKL